MMKTMPDRPIGLMSGEVPVEWNESFSFSKRGSYCFDAASYNSWVKSLFPDIFDNFKPSEENKFHYIKDYLKIGNYYFYLLKFPMWSYSPECTMFGVPINIRWRRNRLPVYHSFTKTSYVSFSDDINIPVLATRSRYDTLDAWMSLTPMEVATQRPQIRRTKGYVGMAGLGMGWCARKVLERSQVKHLTIVEKDEDLLNYFGGRLVAEFGHRVKLINDNAYYQDWSGYDVTIWDIWKSAGDAGSDSRFLKIRESLRKSGKVCEGWTCWTSG